jgi:hypothetical protein
MNHDGYHLDFSLKYAARLYRWAAMIVVPMFLGWMYL